MTDEEILNKYESKINKDIEKVIKDFSLIDSNRIIHVAKNYRQSFILGFRKGQTELIKMMLKQGNSVTEIAKLTGLSEEIVEELKNV